MDRADLHSSRVADQMRQSPDPSVFLIDGQLGTGLIPFPVFRVIEQFRQSAVQTTAHLLGRLFGKGDSDQIFRFAGAGNKVICNAAHHCISLARTRSRLDKVILLEGGGILCADQLLAQFLFFRFHGHPKSSFP